MPVVKRLMESLEEIKELHRRKNDDYASSNNPFSNFDVSTYLLGIFINPRDQSFIWPIAAKLARLSTLLNSGNTPNNESIHDSLLDIATYTLLWDADIFNRFDNVIKNNTITSNVIDYLDRQCFICPKVRRPAELISLSTKDITYYFCSYACLLKYVNEVD